MLCKAKVCKIIEYGTVPHTILEAVWFGDRRLTSITKDLRKRKTKTD